MIDSKLLWVFLMLVITFFAFKLFKPIAKVVTEVFIVLKALAGPSYSIKRHLRLYPHLCETQKLDDVSMKELYHFYVSDSGIASEGRPEDLNKVIRSYSHILLCRERTDGSLRGAALLGFEHRGDYNVMKIGLALFKKHYKGSPYFYIITILFVIKNFFRYPFTPMYVVGKTYSYRGYMTFTVYDEFYPRYNRETPAHFKKVLHEFADEVLKMRGPGVKYNPETFVVEQEYTRLRDNLLAITDEEMQNPHVRFFVESNPGWTKGHCMVCALNVTWANFISGMYHGMMKALKPPEQGADGPRRSIIPNGTDSHLKKRNGISKPKLYKRFTFQDVSAEWYTNFFMENEEDIMLSPKPFAVDKSTNITSPTELDVNFDELSI